MAGDRPRYGLLISALGAIVLAVSVFLPWYGVSFTAAGIAFAQQAGDQAAAQFGNATLQSYMGEFHANLSSLAGHQFTALSAHQALKDLNVVLLLLAGAAIVIALLALAGAGFSSASSPDGHRGPLALLGIVAAVCVLFRIVDPPTPAGNFQAGPAAFDGASGNEIGAAGGGGGPGADFISTAEITLLSAPAFLSAVRASAEVSYLPGDASIVVTIRSSDSPAFKSLMTASLFISCCAKRSGEMASNARAGSLLRMQVLLGIQVDGAPGLRHSNHQPKFLVRQDQFYSDAKRSPGVPSEWRGRKRVT